MREKIRKKARYFSYLWIPLLYIIFPKGLLTFILIPPVIMFSAIKIIKKKFRQHVLLNNFENYYKAEIKRFESKFYFTLSSLLTIIIFPKNIAILSLAVLIITNATFLLIEKEYKKIKIPEKSIEEFLVFAISGISACCLFMLLLRTYYPLFTIAVVISGTTKLILSKTRINHNFSIPFSFAISLSLL